jgi:hypothetical protein
VIFSLVFLLCVMAVVIIMPAVFFVPVTIRAAGYILPMLSVTFTDEVASKESDARKSEVVSVSAR